MIPITIAVENAIKGVTNGFARFALNYGAAFISEGLEEGAQEILTPLFENIAFGYNRKGFKDIDWSEVAYSFLLGGLSGGMFETVGSGVKQISSIASVMKEYNTAEKTQNLLKLALSFSKESNAYKLATKFNDQIKSNGKLSANKVYNLVIATENIVTERLTKLGETENVSAVASAAVKAVTTGQLTQKEMAVLLSSEHGTELLKEINVTEEAETSVLQSSANGENVQNSTLQSSTEGDIINDRQETVTGDDINGNTDPELLAGRRVSAAGGSRNNQRTYGANTGIIRGSLGNAHSAAGISDRNVAAGESGWISSGEGGTEQRLGFGLDEGLLGSIRGVKLKSTDSVGRILSEKLQDKLADTVFKTEDGTIMSLFHWSPNLFDEFKYGDGAFHLGTLTAALTVKRRDIQQRPGHILETYVLSKNPLIIRDAGQFGAYAICEQLVEYGIMSREELNYISEMEGFFSDRYDALANVYVREHLKKLGYDSYLYQNLKEAQGTWSVGVFDPDQIVIVADNGILKPNNGVSEADSENGPASFMPENGSGDSNNASDDYNDDSGGELHQDGDMVTFGGIDTENGKHLDKAQQDEIKDIGKKLKQEVVFEDFYKLEKFKGKKKVPDGFLGADGKVHINYYAKRPVQFLLKHEITHYLKRKLSDFAYQDFMGFVLKSKAFTNWMHSKGFASMTDLKKDVYDRYSEVKNFNEEKCYDEILADFVGDYLFGGENAISQKLIDALAPKQKKTFIETIKDIIAYIKGIFSEKARQKRLLQKEISDLEERFLQLYNEAVAAPVKENADSGDVFSIGTTEENNPVVVVNDDILKNAVDEKDIISIVKKSLGRFKRVPIKGQSIHFVSETKKEYTFSEYTKYIKRNDPQIYQDKMRLAAHPQDIVYATTDYINEGLKHTRKDNIVDFARGKILIDVSGRKYSAEVVIGFTKNGICQLHDIVKMSPTNFEYKKEATSKDIDSYESSRSDVTSNNKIPHEEDSVNNKFMQENEKNSEESEDYSIPAATNPEELLEAYENGEISRQEYLDALNKEKTLNPVEIANSTENDANTTPKLKKKQGESDGDKESKFYSSVMESDIFDLNFKAEAATKKAEAADVII